MKREIKSQQKIIEEKKILLNGIALLKTKAALKMKS